jgi:hypothetical protein
VPFSNTIIKREIEMLDDKFKPNKDGSGFIVEDLINLIPSKQELRLLKWVMLARSLDETREALLNVKFTETGMEATDGWRLHRVTYKNGHVPSFPVGLHFVCAIHKGMVILEPYSGKKEFPVTDDRVSSWTTSGVSLKKTAKDGNKYSAIFGVDPFYLKDALSLASTNRAFIELRDGPLYVHYDDEYGASIEAFVMPIYSERTKDFATGRIVTDNSNFIIQEIS